MSKHHDDPEVAAVIRLFTDGDTAARVAFVERCPDTPLKETVLTAVKTGFPETMYMALCMLADPYCRGLDPSLGIAIVQAVYAMSQRAFAETKASDYLDTAAQAAVTCLLGYNSLGRYDDATRFGETVADWLDAEGHTVQKASLLMSRIDAHLGLAQFNEAGALLDAAEAIEIPPSRLADRTRLQSLRLRFDSIARQRATELPQVPQSDAGVFAADRRELADQLQQLQSLLNGQEDPGIQNFASALAAQLEKSASASRPPAAYQSHPTRRNHRRAASP